MKYKKTISLVIILILTAAVLYSFRSPLSVAIAKNMVTQRMAADTLKSLPDGLHIAVCGAGSPMPDDERGGACTVVIAGSKIFVFDAGNMSARNIGKMGFNHGQIEGIFLTHFHSDHIDGLGELMLQRWVSNSNPQPVPVYGPPGVQDVVGGFMQAYSHDRHYRVAHHGQATLPTNGFGANVKTFELKDTQANLVFEEGDTRITAFAVSHAPVHPAVGYRIQYKDRAIVLSGDTTPSAVVQREAQNVDVLVHEAMSSELMQVLQTGAQTAGRSKLQKLMVDIVDYHSTPVQAAERAHDAQVGFLLLNHIAPPLPLPGLKDIFLKGTSDAFKGRIQIARDGDFLSLPAGSKLIETSRRF